MSQASDPKIPDNEWGCAQLLFPIVMVCSAVAGWIWGGHWGMTGSILGAIVGCIAGVPITGVMLLIVIGIAFLVDKVKGNA